MWRLPVLWLLWGKLRSLVKTGHQCKWDKGVERVAAAGSPTRLEGPGSSSLSQGKLLSMKLLIAYLGLG